MQYTKMSTPSRQQITRPGSTLASEYQSWTLMRWSSLSEEEDEEDPRVKTTGEKITGIAMTGTRRTLTLEMTSRKDLMRCQTSQ